ncbi:hypothetical protein H310_13553 [Aphanomyces invadans]|uniref:Uncharacterized protein n=1 Tax=Aphanomyces invadans TaxID=157072 RepID=A0A024TDA4_9STRA|nr:hypothetical protein H310_13553 [Aphanomyces invadans]ETV92028.1 hypothetical protein H310_13553 [Aphanomyces invadans]|eukprot:XP_008879325.1 hypothetical protein H310_13553 [Aphanomyces invadans]
MSSVGWIPSPLTWQRCRRTCTLSTFSPRFDGWTIPGVQFLQR